MTSELYNELKDMIEELDNRKEIDMESNWILLDGRYISEFLTHEKPINKKRISALGLHYLVTIHIDVVEPQYDHILLEQYL